VTDAFEGTARRLLTSLGYPGIPLIVTPNPVIYLSDAQIQERVTTLLDQVVGSFETHISGHKHDD